MSKQEKVKFEIRLKDIYCPEDEMKFPNVAKDIDDSLRDKRKNEK